MSQIKPSALVQSVTVLAARCLSRKCVLSVLVLLVASVAAANEMDDLVKAVNTARAQAKLPPLKVDLKLCEGCTQHSVAMWRSGTMYHAGGYRENVAMGQTSVSQVMGSWMNSSGHRNNILSRSTRLGVGKCGRFWTQRFQ